LLYITSALDYMIDNGEELPRDHDGNPLPFPESQPSRYYAAGLMYALSERPADLSNTEYVPIEGDHNFWRGFVDVLGSVEWRWIGGRPRLGRGPEPKRQVPRFRLTCHLYEMNAFCDFVHADWMERHQNWWATLPADLQRLDQARQTGTMDMIGRHARWVVDAVYGGNYVCVLPQREEMVRLVQGWVDPEPRI